MLDAMIELAESIRREAYTSALAEGGYQRQALLEVLCARLVEAEHLAEPTVAYFEGTGFKSKRLLLDGYDATDLALSGSLQLISLIPQSGTGSGPLSTSDISTAYKHTLAFLQDALSGYLEKLEPSLPAADLAALIYAKRADITNVRIVVLSDMEASKSFKNKDYEMLGDIRVDLDLWDLERFFKLEAAGGHEPINIDLLTYLPSGIPSLKADVGANMDYESYLCVVPGRFLADIYADLGSRLLEGNVRAFLSARGNVNKGLRATIIKQPERFFAFNNGVTATASSIERDSKGNITRIVDLQIVNGGQTTASLFNTRAKDKVSLERVSVQMKLSVVPPDIAQQLVPDIAKYANTQNKVSDADLFANHAFHRRVEELARRIWAPAPTSNEMTHWFYERARAQYETEQIKLTPAKRKAFQQQNPRDQVITKTDLAKFENSWRKRPHDVSQGAQKNFIIFAGQMSSEFEANPNQIHDVWFHHLVAKAIIFKSTEELVSKAPWYANGYRANTVTYAIARLAKLIEDDFPGRALDLSKIWKQQSLSSPLSAQISLVAEQAQRIIGSPPAQWKNVTEWAKKRQCWDAVADAAVELVPDLSTCLISSKAFSDQVAAATGNAKTEAVINNVMDAVRLSQQGYWQLVLDSAEALQLLSETERGIIETAATKGPKWVPTDAQAKRMMEAKRRLDEIGFS